MRFSFTSVAVVLLILIGLAFIAWHEWRLLPDPHAVIVRFFDVGQGDSIFITGPHGEQILVDGGPDLTALEDLGQSMPFFDRSIDWLILTHPHLDHVASFPEILKRYRVGHVLITGADYSNGRYEEFLSELHDQNVPVMIADPSKDLHFTDGLTLDVIYPPPIYFDKTVAHIHDTCIVFKMIYGSGSILFTGDAEAKTEQALMNEHLNLHADILKVGHHGSLTSSSSGFLLAVHPQLAIISVGKGNTYGLPKQTILDRLTHFGIPYKTTMSGTITVTMNKENWAFQQ
ncbi:MAG TPA: ComEC/Rec2 family competence protein [Candidatus Peribacteraceae bacterium]|nr:ComEC/Rec2 family competence protein [Candidatus Peribacteraceae bacterium]